MHIFTYLKMSLNMSSLSPKLIRYSHRIFSIDFLVFCTDRNSSSLFLYFNRELQHKKPTFIYCLILRRPTTSICLCLNL